MATQRRGERDTTVLYPAGLRIQQHGSGHPDRVSRVQRRTQTGLPTGQEHEIGVDEVHVPSGGQPQRLIDGAGAALRPVVPQDLVRDVVAYRLDRRQAFVQQLLGCLAGPVVDRDDLGALLDGLHERVQKESKYVDVLAHGYDDGVASSGVPVTSFRCGIRGAHGFPVRDSGGCGGVWNTGPDATGPGVHTGTLVGTRLPDPTYSGPRWGLLTSRQGR